MHRSLLAGAVAEAAALHTDFVSRSAERLGIGDTRGLPVVGHAAAGGTDGVGAAVDVLLRDRNLEVERFCGVPRCPQCPGCVGPGRCGPAATRRRPSWRTHGGRGFAVMPHDFSLPVTRVAWAEAAAIVGDGDACAARGPTGSCPSTTSSRPPRWVVRRIDGPLPGPAGRGLGGRRRGRGAVRPGRGGPHPGRHPCCGRRPRVDDPIPPSRRREAQNQISQNNDQHSRYTYQRQGGKGNRILTVLARLRRKSHSDNALRICCRAHRQRCAEGHKAGRGREHRWSTGSACCATVQCSGSYFRSLSCLLNSPPRSGCGAST